MEKFTEVIVIDHVEFPLTGILINGRKNTRRLMFLKQLEDAFKLSRDFAIHAPVAESGKCWSRRRQTAGGLKGGGKKMRVIGVLKTCGAQQDNLSCDESNSFNNYSIHSSRANRCEEERNTKYKDENFPIPDYTYAKVNQCGIANFLGHIIGRTVITVYNKNAFSPDNQQEISTEIPRLAKLKQN